MATVFRATDLTLGRTVALKLIDPGLAGDPVFRARFERECRLAASLDHPHVVDVFHAGEERGLLYVTMRYVEGTDLRSLLTVERRLDAGRAVAILSQVGDALDEAHRHGLIHRDVKPGNILLRRRDATEHAYLTDFGITKERTTRATSRAPASRWARPTSSLPSRRAAGRRRTRRRLCAGLRPLHGADGHGAVRARQRRRHALGTRPRAAPALLDARPDLPSGLAPVIERALAKDAAERPVVRRGAHAGGERGL
jgi:serine/threonine-protein kinase